MGSSPEGSVIEVRLGDIRADPPWQREQDPARVRKMSAEWDDVKAGIIVLVQRGPAENNGCAFSPIDGGHRFSAKKLRFDEDASIRALVHGPELDDKKCAEMFLDLNKSVKVSIIDKFHAELVAEHGWAIGLDSVLAERDLGVGHNGGSRTVRAASALITSYMHKKNGASSVPLALDAMLEIWGAREETWEAPLVAGFPAFFRTWPQADHRRVVKRVREAYPEPKRLTATAHSNVAIKTGGSGATTSRAQEVALLIADAYDYRLPVTRKLQSPTVI